MAITEGGRFSPVQRIVSPGVFTRENDLSGLAQGIADIGGAVVAPFADGPAFYPTLITDINELERKFGVADGIYYGPYTAKEYLAQQGVVTVVRVGGLTGYWQKDPLVLYAEPGTWNRSTDVAALTTASFMYLDSDDYVSNIQLKLSSSFITSSLNSVPNADGSITVARASSAEINTFLNTLPSGLSAGKALLSASLAASSSLGKVLKITATDYQTDFSSSVEEAGYQVGDTSEYSLAHFDFMKSRLSGSISSSLTGGATLQYDTSTFTTASSGINTAHTQSPYYMNYLTNSYDYNNGDIIYGLVFAKDNSDNTRDYSAVTYDLANSTSSFEFRYDISTMEFSGSVFAKFGSKSSTSGYAADYDGTGADLSGSVLYAGKQFTLGTIKSGLLIRPFSSGGPSQSGVGEFYLTSSVQGKYNSNAETYIQRAINESTETVSKISSSLLISGATLAANTSNISFNGSLTPYSSSFKAVRSAAVCGAGLQFTSLISGEFGKYTGEFTSTYDGNSDPCLESGATRERIVLGTLTNTQNGSTQFNDRYEVFGFNGSLLSQKYSTIYPYSGSINPNENEYTLELKYNYTDDDGNAIAGTYGFYDFSLDTSDNLYIKNVFGTNPTAGNPAKQVSGQKVEAAYLYTIFEDSIKKFKSEKTRESSLGGGWDLRLDVAGANGSLSVGESLRFTDQYSLDPNSGDSEFSITNAYTPWVMSQRIAPFKGNADQTATPTKYKLFKVHTLSDGTKSNTKYKIEISNVKLAGTVAGSNYGTFTLSVRDYSDTDKRPKYLETYQNLNLDPDSPNYIARRIGDRYSYITFAGKIIEFGTYPTLSKYIRVQMNDINWPETVVPYGFEAYKSPLGGTLSTLLPPVKYSKASIYGLGIGKYPSGTVFNSAPGADDEIMGLYPTSSLNVGVVNDTKQYFKPLPAYGSNDQNGQNVDFDLEQKTYGETNSAFYANSTGSLLSPALSGSIPSTLDPVNESTYVRMRKFVFGFQGGFDGTWPAIPINVGSDITAGNTQGMDCTTISSPGSIAYKQCITSLGNADEFDINLIILPGIFREQHSYVTDITIDMCEARGDCFYIMDNVVFPSSNQSTGLISSAINSIATIDSNYVATYYPWVKVLDTNLNKVVSVPPSVVLPAVYASSDNAAAEWFAPAGLNRGGIPSAVQVLDRLTHSERDELYENRINPIAAFPNQGICAWGQKTLQIEESALDRINVRRLLINLKKYIASASKYLVFEQNVAATRNRFLSIANPYLESVQQRSGLYAYEVKMDDDNNSSDLIDRNFIYGQIFLQPTKTGEKLVLDFNILPTGASFDV